MVAVLSVRLLNSWLPVDLYRLRFERKTFQMRNVIRTSHEQKRRLGTLPSDIKHTNGRRRQSCQGVEGQAYSPLLSNDLKYRRQSYPVNLRHDISNSSQALCHLKEQHDSTTMNKSKAQIFVNIFVLILILTALILLYSVYKKMR